MRWRILVGLVVLIAIAFVGARLLESRGDEARRASSGLPQTSLVDAETTNVDVAADEAEPSWLDTTRESVTHELDSDEPILVHGRVIDERGRPVPGARLHARSGGWYSVVPTELSTNERIAYTTSDAEGRFRFTRDLEPGDSLGLAVVAEGFALRRLGRVPFPAAPLDLGDLMLSVGRSLFGRCLDAEGRPLPGVDVLVAAVRGVDGLEGTYPGLGRLVTTTDRRGEFRVEGVAPGRWHLLFDHPEHPVVERSGVERRTTDTELGDVRLGVGRELLGRIRGLPPERSGEFLVQVLAENDFSAAARRPRRVPVDGEGRFRLRGLPDVKLLRITVGTLEANGRFVPSTEVAPRLTNPANGHVELEFGEPLTLVARVVDEAGRAIERFEAFSQLGYFGGERAIGGEGPGETREVHPDGRLVASGLSLYTEETVPKLVIRALGYQALSREVEGLDPGRRVDLGELVLAAEPILEVRVTDPQGRPLPDARVRVAKPHEGWLEATTDATGLAVLPHRRAARPRVRVTHPTHSPLERELAPFEPVDRAVAVQLRPGAELVVTVPARPGVRVHAQELALVPVGDEADEDRCVRVARSTDAGGRVAFRGLEAGSWKLIHQAHVRTPEGSPVPGTMRIDLAPGEVRHVQFELVPEARLEGQLRDALGPLGTATLRLIPRDRREGETGDRDGWGSPFNRITDAFGRFLFEHVPEGPYELEIEHDARSMIFQVPLDVRIGDAPLDLLLPSATLRVRVVDESGAPVGGAHVRLQNTARRSSGWNDSRTALIDERGELKQSWDQQCVYHRTSDADGWATFAGATPGVEGRFDLFDAGSVPSRSRVDGAPDGGVRDAVEPLVFRPSGRLSVWTTGVVTSWRLRVSHPARDLDPLSTERIGEAVNYNKLYLPRVGVGTVLVEIDKRDERGDWLPVAELTTTIERGVERRLSMSWNAEELREE